MAGDTDFLVLYEELGLSPGISDLDALKHAYRRRVAQLHPDRRTADQADTDRLQRLNRLYGAALAFEQRYGRLPAATAGTRRVDAVRADETPSPARTNGGHERHVQRTRTMAAPRRNRARYYLALVILLALAFAVWGVGVVAR